MRAGVLGVCVCGGGGGLPGGCGQVCWVWGGLPGVCGVEGNPAIPSRYVAAPRLPTDARFHGDGAGCAVFVGGPRSLGPQRTSSGPQRAVCGNRRWPHLSVMEQRTSASLAGHWLQSVHRPHTGQPGPLTGQPSPLCCQAGPPCCQAGPLYVSPVRSMSARSAHWSARSALL